MANTTNNPANTMSVNDKAAAILRAKLPELAEYGLNFEKRTGNFFVGTKTTNDAGEEVLKRTTIADDDALKLAPEEQRAAVSEAMANKRAAGIVAMYETHKAAKEEKLAEARKVVEEYEQSLADLAAEYADACATVEAFELPEKAQRATFAQTTAKLSAAEEELARLRALLASAGIEA